MTARSQDLQQRTDDMKKRLTETIGQLRQDINESDDQQFAALCETSAEVLGGIVTAIEHYQAGQEKAWR